MQVSQKSSRPLRNGSAEWFAGVVTVEPLHDAQAPASTSCALVSFAAGARTAWHTHPLGQTLIITQGSGLVQTWGGPVTAVNVGDVIWFAAGEKHWHGATATTALSHIAIHEALDGKNVDWLEQVSKDQYKE